MYVNTSLDLQVWMEVDVSHPALFDREQQQRQQQQQSSSSGGDGGRVRLAEWRRDLAGNPRFCCWELD